MTEKVTNTATPCETCPIRNAAALKKLGVDMTDFDFVGQLLELSDFGSEVLFFCFHGWLC